MTLFLFFFYTNTYNFFSDADYADDTDSEFHTKKIRVIRVIRVSYSSLSFIDAINPFTCSINRVTASLGAAMAKALTTCVMRR